MSDRLYYTDSYLNAFDAVVRESVPQGDAWMVVLDRTAFYPTSGGQPHDVGTLNDSRILDVIDRADGSIGHLVDGQLAVDQRVRGVVDWNRRFDHMQQHSGQHLLSAVLDREHSARTVSFHLGTATSTIDLDRELTAAQIDAAESAANRIIWEDRPIAVRFVSEQEAAKLALRKDPARTGDLRIVEIADCDLSAWGGTHVGRTGAIGLIAVAGTERFKGGMRVEFVCGSRALRDHRRLRDVVTKGVRLLSVLPEELPAAIDKLQLESRAQKKLQQALQEQLASHEAVALASRSRKLDGTSVVLEAVAGWDGPGLKKLASAVAAHRGFVAVLISSDAPFLIVAARSADLTLDTGVLLRRLLDRFGGKGGGKGAMAQGGGLNGTADEILAAAHEVVASELETP
jgi:alanyl-tRNA synthetase